MFFDVLDFRVFLRYQALVLGMFLDRFATHLRAEMCAYLIICDICIDVIKCAMNNRARAEYNA